jgi:hypothetical protein
MFLAVYKGRTLVIASTVIYIVSVMGPFKIFNTEGFVDRLNRCRDYVDRIVEFGYWYEMPAFLKTSMKQYTTEDGNGSRFVTKLHWMVESADRSLKRWKLLSKIHSLPFLGDSVKIVGALTTLSGTHLVSDIAADEHVV